MEWRWGNRDPHIWVWDTGSQCHPSVPCFPEPHGGASQANQMARRKDSVCSQHSRRPSYASATHACGGRKLLDFVPGHVKAHWVAEGVWPQAYPLASNGPPPHGIPECSHTESP